MPSDPRDIGFDEDGRWFRLRACAVLLREGKVLMARNGFDPYAYSVGGGVHHGESLEDAVRRELREETGLDLEIDRLLFVHDQVFTTADSDRLAGRLCHEIAFYFLMHDDGSPVRSGSTTQHGDSEWCQWIPVAEYGRDITMYPRFLARGLLDLPTAPRMIVERDLT